jgi:hypothetical protein
MAKRKEEAQSLQHCEESPRTEKLMVTVMLAADGLHKPPLIVLVGAVLPYRLL